MLKQIGIASALSTAIIFGGTLHNTVDASPKTDCVQEHLYKVYYPMEINEDMMNRVHQELQELIQTGVFKNPLDLNQLLQQLEQGIEQTKHHHNGVSDDNQVQNQKPNHQTDNEKPDHHVNQNEDQNHHVNEDTTEKPDVNKGENDSQKPGHDDKTDSNQSTNDQQTEDNKHQENHGDVNQDNNQTDDNQGQDNGESNNKQDQDNNQADNNQGQDNDQTDDNQQSGDQGSVDNQAPSEQPNQDQTTKPNDNQASSAISAYEKQVVELTNNERTSRGLKPLTINQTLSKSAHEKSRNMSQLGYFSHTSPTYGSPFDMMKSYGITYQSAGENIARGQKTPKEVVNGWMNSQGHRENILNPNFTEIGVGYVADGNYWTQQFIGK